jgi:hypothetical protein
MTFRFFSGTDPDYDVLQEFPGAWTVGKFFKVRRKADGKVTKPGS